jgi:murein DD-endopeptidase MepM/ murein hydrolase activator NlpD
MKGVMSVRNLSAKSIGLVLCAFLALPLGNAFALSHEQRPQRASTTTIDQLKGDLEVVTKEEAKQYQKYLSAKTESDKANANLASLNRKIASAEADRNQAQQDADTAKAEYAASQAKYDKAVKDSDDAKKRRSKAIARLYQESSDPDAVPSVLSASPEDRENVVRKAILMQNYNGQQTKAIADAKGAAENAVQEKATHQDAQQRAEVAEQKAADDEATLVSLRAELVTAQKKAKDKLNAQNSVLKSLRSKKSSYTSQIAAMQAASSSLSKTIKKKQSQSPVVPSPGGFIRPCSGPITSPYGLRTHPVYGDPRMHTGVDFGGSIGVSIKAAKAGRVIFVGQMSGYGNVVVVDHGGGISTLYGHLNGFAVSNGQKVSQGQLIAYMGATGLVTGPNLHFEVRVNGNPVDPMGYL